MVVCECQRRPYSAGNGQQAGDCLARLRLRQVTGGQKTVINLTLRDLANLRKWAADERSRRIVDRLADTYIAEHIGDNRQHDEKRNYVKAAANSVRKREKS